MIPANAVTAWSVNHPWPTREQVEQDLLLSRAICAIAQDDYLSHELVFRGGTALHKLHLKHPYRYSEDLDYVRSSATGIGPPHPGAQPARRRPRLHRQHPRQRTPQGLLADDRDHRRPTADQDRSEHPRTLTWWSGTAAVRTFAPAELMATKIRALYQRSKRPRPVRPVARTRTAPPSGAGDPGGLRALPTRRTHRDPSAGQPRKEAPGPTLPQRPRPVGHRLARQLPRGSSSRPDQRPDPRPPRRLATRPTSKGPRRLPSIAAGVSRSRS